MSFQRFVIRTVWPWFRKYVWPIIGQYVIDLIKALTDEIRQRFGEWLRESREREENARGRADAARKAQECAEQQRDHVEAEKQNRIAEVWREVAEVFRQENESLKEQVAMLLRKADSVADEVKKGVSLETSGDRPALVLGGRLLALPEASEAIPDVVCPKCGAEIR